VPFEHLAALRELSYLTQGREPPALSRERLDAFLDEVWADRYRLRGGPARIYELYAAASEPNPVTRSPQSYANALLELADSRPPGTQTVVQEIWEDLRTLRDNGALTLGIMNDGNFFHYQRYGTDSDYATERVCVNARADHAPELMSALVREVVDSPAEYPGVFAAKVAGYGTVGDRPDNIVIYTNGDAFTKRVVDWLAGYQERHPDAFMWSTPSMTEQVLKGVGRGSEPHTYGVSFGSVRAQIIFDALYGRGGRGGTRDDFGKAVLEGLERAGIDPRAPHRNLPGKAP
jgi:hypothetical protein